MAGRLYRRGMGEIVNLRRVRKARARAAAADVAAERRVLHGRTQAEVLADTAERGRVARVVDGAFVGEGGAGGAVAPPPTLFPEGKGV